MSHAIILLGIVLLFFLHFETINWYQVGLTIFAIAVYIFHDVYIKRFKSLYTAYELAGFHHNKRGISEEELLVKLKKLYKKHGYLISHREKIVNWNTVLCKERFGVESWKQFSVKYQGDKGRSSFRLKLQPI